MSKNSRNYGTSQFTLSRFSATLLVRFDTDGYKAVQSEKFLKRLTNEPIGDQSAQLTRRDEEEEEEEEIFQPLEENPNKGETPRSTSDQRERGGKEENSSRLASRPPPAADENQIQKWLNHKFPQGFAGLEKSLERLDTKQMGTVSSSPGNSLSLRLSVSSSCLAIAFSVN